MTTLYLIRHGQAGDIHGQYDSLSDLGWRQATLLGEYFHHHRADISEVWCGTLQRQRLTQEAMQLGTRNAERTWHDPALDEIPFQQLLILLQEQYPTHPSLVSRGPKPTPVQFQARLEAAIDLWQQDRLVGIETPWSSYANTLQRWLRGRCLTADADNAIVAISSAGAIAMLLVLALGLEHRDIHAFNTQLFNTSVTAVKLRKEGPIRLTLYNSVAHLQTLNQPELLTTI